MYVAARSSGFYSQRDSRTHPIVTLERGNGWPEGYLRIGARKLNWKPRGQRIVWLPRRHIVEKYHWLQFIIPFLEIVLRSRFFAAGNSRRSYRCSPIINNKFINVYAFELTDWECQKIIRSGQKFVRISCYTGCFRIDGTSCKRITLRAKVSQKRKRRTTFSSYWVLFPNKVLKICQVHVHLYTISRVRHKNIIIK